MYIGSGVEHEWHLPPAPPWRTFPRRKVGHVFNPPAGLVDAVNAAICLRRPLLLTGHPGSGKSTVIESVADELNLGPVLRWHITSRSTLADALYRYDVLGRIHAQQLASSAADDISTFIQLGPLGTALLPAEIPRPLLIDEIDKSDLDLPSDLLDVLERGYFEIIELSRLDRRESVPIRQWASRLEFPIVNGIVQCSEFPFIVMTSNGERDFPAPFLRRCIRFDMPAPTVESISAIVAAHLSLEDVASDQMNMVVTFVDRVLAGETLAIDQLLNAIFLISEDRGIAEADMKAVIDTLLRDLTRG
ncbi:ATPase [Mycolicibacterium fortuitum]|uniref:AAA family ATPase n=1 Tax=Mycolicibacterium fortuitum TaxID=1766 RepID=UPI0007EB5965|nr:AAA family ATPase [Mycolicibacterium fortuitum]OBG53702.1 ATPase [Mycolicibacterium fortuitum]